MLTTNPLLEQVVTKLAHHRPNWPEVINMFQKRPVTELRRELAGVLAEFHVRSALSDICSDLSDRANFYPIDDGSKTHNFKFDYTGDNIIVKRSGTDEVYAEIDALLTLDGLPVIVEVKVRNRRSGQNGHRIRHELQPPAYSRKTEPICEYFGIKHVGLVMVIPQSVICAGSPVQQSFKADGGKIVPFYASPHDFRTEIKRVRKNYCLGKYGE